MTDSYWRVRGAKMDLRSNHAHSDDLALVTRQAPAAVPASRFVAKHLTDDGTSSGSRNGNGNYASSAQRFFRGPPAGKKWVVSRLMGEVVDSGSFDSGSYGNAISLTNGILVEVWDGSSVLLDLTDDEPIITNVDWAHHCYDVSLSTFGVGNEYMAIRWTFSRAGKGILLDGDATESIAIKLNDNLSGLVGHYFMIQGYQIDG